MTSYDVQVTREGKWWQVAIPALDLLTQARRIGEADLMAREAIAVTLDVPLSQVAVSVHLADLAGHPDLLTTASELSARDAEAEAIKRDVASQRAAIAKALAGAGVPYRDIGEQIGLTYQRAQQLATAP